MYLRWSTQLKKTVVKENQMLGVLKRNRRHCPRSIKNMAYKTILKPKLEYVSAVWDPFTEDNIRKLEAVQRRAARFVCNSYRQTASVSSPSLENKKTYLSLYGGLFVTLFSVWGNFVIFYSYGVFFSIWK